jgi:hypothetical protein
MGERQEWCLHCGAAVGTRVVAAPGWRAPIAIAGALLAVALIAITVAIVQLADDTEQVAGTPAAATPAPTAAVPALTPTPTPAVPAAEETPAPTPTPTATPTPTSTPSGGDDTWPRSKSGWTVVLSSDTSEAEAREQAERFAADGIAGVGVLDSDDFSSLKAGFWVVFAGQYDDQAAAADALDGIDAKDAYIRRITPD